MQIIVFRAAQEEFGIPIDTVREIIKMSAATPIPNSPTFIKGIINVRGEIVTAIDIKAHLSLHGESSTEAKHIIVTKQADCLYGLMVDEVIEIIRFKDDIIKQPFMANDQKNRDYVMGFVSYENRLIVLLDVTKIFIWPNSIAPSQVSQSRG